MKAYLIVLSITLIFLACNPRDENSGVSSTPISTSEVQDGKELENPAYDPNRGAGKFSNVSLSEKLDASLAVSGSKVYGVKCGSCHKLTDERLVGPGWKGVTGRHKPEWILNFVTNTDEMITKDPKAQAQLEICLVRMPNQNISDVDAMSLLEFMRKNDGIK